MLVHLRKKQTRAREWQDNNKKSRWKMRVRQKHYWQSRRSRATAAENVIGNTVQKTKV